jgi:hypothetical protein
MTSANLFWFLRMCSGSWEHTTIEKEMKWSLTYSTQEGQIARTSVIARQSKQAYGRVILRNLLRCIAALNSRNTNSNSKSKTCSSINNQRIWKIICEKKILRERGKEVSLFREAWIRIPVWVYDSIPWTRKWCPLIRNWLKGGGARSREIIVSSPVFASYLMCAWGGWNVTVTRFCIFQTKFS